ncbi:MAG: protein translocase subunit SecD [Chloroflexi bacterium]|nr:MAG: protein translocase subunit SecD [Phototrophicales bacterium]RMF79321.1 MAG: protein translocase subunit SecD [Chloroflexota bacterium]
MRSSQNRWLIFILLLTAFATIVSLPDSNGIHIDIDADGESDININARQSLGLDLVGGLRVVLEAEVPTDSFEEDDLRETANNVARRVNALGVGEATIQVQGNNRVLVELPGVSDPQQAIETIQQTALLEFVDFANLGGRTQEYINQRILTTKQVEIQEQRALANEDASADETTPDSETGTDEQLPPPLLHPFSGQPFVTVMTGAGLKAAAATIDPGTGRWAIQFELSDEGREIFGPFTAQRIGEPMAIVLDGVVLSAPVIRSRLDTGGTITGNFTEESARQLALQLRSGALPIPLRVETAERVGATLGRESVELSIRAGIIGIIVVLAFMLIYYRLPGLSADLALLVFIALNMAVFKLVPITLTLPAITGFLISVGTAVDGNILIFERIKEELRDGRELDDALEAGFDRAWNSIRDSNLSTIIIAGILFLFGQTPGASIVSGFAITLALGLVLNLFTAVIVTRTFLHVLVGLMRQRLTSRAWLLGV